MAKLGIAHWEMQIGIYKPSSAVSTYQIPEPFIASAIFPASAVKIAPAFWTGSAISKGNLNDYFPPINPWAPATMVFYFHNVSLRCMKMNDNFPTKFYAIFQD